MTSSIQTPPTMRTREHKNVSAPRSQRGNGSLARRLFGESLLVAIAMAIVGVLLTGLGALILQAGGGIDRDTGYVVLVAAFAVTDLWGGAVLGTRTPVPQRAVVASWMTARFVLLALVTIAAPALLVVALVQIVIAAPACALGVRAGRKQATLRRP